MAIEDEIVNISDLDVGNEILQTDKLLIETNAGTKLLDFKDFVIGVNNISFYHLISGRGDATGATEKEIVGGYELLTTNTDENHKPSYEDLRGTIGLTKRNYDAYTWVAANSGKPAQNFGDIQNILSRLGHIQALLEKPITADLSTVEQWKVKLTGVTDTNSNGKTHNAMDIGEIGTLQFIAGSLPTITVPARLTSDTASGNIKSVNFKTSVVSQAIAVTSDYSLRFNRKEITPDIGTLTQSPFKMVYPDTEFITSTISFSVYIEIIDQGVIAGQAANPIQIFKTDEIVRKSYPQEITTGHFVYDFSFITEVAPNDIITFKYNNIGAKIQPGSSFSGVRMF